MTARLATHPDVAARVPDVLEHLLSAGVDIERVAVGEQGAATRNPLQGVRDGQHDLALVGLEALRGAAAEDLTMVATLRREDARDALVSSRGEPSPLRAMRAGARVWVPGPRARAFLAAHRPDLVAVQTDHPAHEVLGGAIDGVDAAVVPAWESRRSEAAERTVELFDIRSWLPAPGQGVVALLSRTPVAEVTALDHLPTRTALRAELALVEALDFGPDVAYGCVAQPSGGQLRLWAAVLSPDGTRIVRSDLTGPLDEPEGLGAAVARQLLRRGADLVREGALT